MSVSKLTHKHFLGAQINEKVSFKKVNQIINVVNNITCTKSQEITTTGPARADAQAIIIGLNVVENEFDLYSVILPLLSEVCELCVGCVGCGASGQCDCDCCEDVITGKPIIIKNLGPETLVIYPQLGDSIDGQAIDLPIELGAGQTIQISSLDCTSWQTYGLSGVVTDATLTGTGTVGDPLTVVPGASALGYAEYVQHSASTNGSVPPGTAVEYLTDNPAGVFNTIGITTTTGPGAVGTEFLLPIGVYVIDFENSNTAAISQAIYKSLVTQVEAIDVQTIVGSSTGTTWIHGRAIINAAAPTYIIISPVTGTLNIPTAGTAAGEFIARLTILKIA